jgi:hypothetical protein
LTRLTDAKLGRPTDAVRRASEEFAARFANAKSVAEHGESGSERVRIAE